MKLKCFLCTGMVILLANPFFFSLSRDHLILLTILRCLISKSLAYSTIKFLERSAPMPHTSFKGSFLIYVLICNHRLTWIS